MKFSEEKDKLESDKLQQLWEIYNSTNDISPLMEFLQPKFSFTANKYQTKYIKAEDILQEVNLDFLTLIKKYDPAKGKFLYWLISKVIPFAFIEAVRRYSGRSKKYNRMAYLSLDRDNKKVHNGRYDFPEKISSEKRSETKAEHSLLMDEIKKVLSPKHIRVLELFSEGYTAEEINKILGYKNSSIIKYRAIEKVCNYLGIPYDKHINCFPRQSHCTSKYRTKVDLIPEQIKTAYKKQKIKGEE